MTEIPITTEYIKLGQLLKFKGIVTNGAETKSYLSTNVIKVNDINENRRGRKLYPNDVIWVANILYVVTKQE